MVEKLKLIEEEDTKMDLEGLTVIKSSLFFPVDFANPFSPHFPQIMHDSQYNNPNQNITKKSATRNSTGSNLNSPNNNNNSNSPWLAANENTESFNTELSIDKEEWQQLLHRALKENDPEATNILLNKVARITDPDYV